MGRRFRYWCGKKVKPPKYSIAACGLDVDSVPCTTVDGNIALIAQHPDPFLHLCPLAQKPAPSYQDALFYADCIAYEHEIPAIVLPTEADFKRFRYRFVHSGPTKPRVGEVVAVCSKEPDGVKTVKRYVVEPNNPYTWAAEWYVRELLAALEQIRHLRHGPFTFVPSKYYTVDEYIDLPLKQKYGRVALAVHLYATGLRQVDWLSEYLCYYRVIESTAGKKHKQWIERSLSKLRKHDFGTFRIMYTHFIDEKPRDIIKVYRRRALLRLNSLAKSLSKARDIADHLYHVNRCGIAHGREIVKSDLTPTYFDVVKDTYVMKLLARIAIDEKSG